MTPESGRRVDSISLIRKVWNPKIQAISNINETFKQQQQLNSINVFMLQFLEMKMNMMLNLVCIFSIKSNAKVIISGTNLKRL